MNRIHRQLLYKNLINYNRQIIAVANKEDDCGCGGNCKCKEDKSTEDAKEK